MSIYTVVRQIRNNNQITLIESLSFTMKGAMDNVTRKNYEGLCSNAFDYKFSRELNNNHIVELNIFDRQAGNVSLRRTCSTSIRLFYNISDEVVGTFISTTSK